jgi:hypothetical protein
MSTAINQPASTSGEKKLSKKSVYRMMLDKQRKAVGDRLERLEQECARSRANKENTSTMSGLTPSKRSGMKTPISL